MFLLPVMMLSFAMPELEMGQLRELLFDRLDPRGQSQAALLLVQSKDPTAEKLVRAGLQQHENEEAFQALATAVRMKQDHRFDDELLAALVANRTRLRQVVAETLAHLADAQLVKKLAALAGDERADLRVRQTALWTLGRSGQQTAVAAVMPHLDGPEELRRIATGALGDLTGQMHGADVAAWKEWWKTNKHMSREQWLEMRLNFHTSRGMRLEGELLRARAQVIRLHQMLYARLPQAERFDYLQSLRDHEDPGVRALAVVFAVELLPSVADRERVRVLSEIVVRLTHDTNPDVQRGAVLALGRFTDLESTERLRELLGSASPMVRAAATRALGAQARGNNPAARDRQRKTLPLLRKALDDLALEVVVEAAEALGSLGAAEAGPVLIDLLKHESENVRQTAAQALERTADASLVEGLLTGLDDPAGSVRFCLVGAVGKAATGKGVRDAKIHQRMLTRLEKILTSDDEINVRGRAATVLGECGGEAQLAPLWNSVQAGAEGRVQDKAWDAMLDILGRTAQIKLVQGWDGELVKAKQNQRRIQLWTRVYTSWEQNPKLRPLSLAALEGLVAALVDDGKWQAAAPLGQTLLARSAEGDEPTRIRCLKLLLRVAELALAEGNKGETLRIVQEVRSYLPEKGSLAEAFEALRRKASRE